MSADVVGIVVAVAVVVVGREKAAAVSARVRNAYEMGAQRQGERVYDKPALAVPGRAARTTAQE
jgi:hypothetical protein